MHAMAPTFDLAITSMLDSVITSPAALLDPEIVSVAFRISLLSCNLAQKLMHCVIPYVLPVMVTIFNCPLTPMSESVHTSPIVVLDSGNVGVALGIVLPSSMEAEIMRFFICTVMTSQTGSMSQLCF